MHCSCRLSGQNLQLEDFLEKEGVVANHAWFYSQIPRFLCWQTDAPKASRAFDALMKQLASKMQGWLMQRKSNAAPSPKIIKNRWSMMIVLQFLRRKGTRPFVLEFAVQCQSPTSVGSHRTVGLVPWVGGWRHWRPGRPCVLTTCPQRIWLKTPKLRTYAGSQLVIHSDTFTLLILAPTHTPAHSVACSNLFILTDSMWSHLLLVVSIMCAMV